MAIDSKLAALHLCYLETTGRRTGQPHSVEMWFAADTEQDRIYCLAGGRDAADWVRNLRANALVRVLIGDRPFSGRAHEIEGTPDEIPARRLVGAKYGYWQTGTALRGWARYSLAIAIDLEQPTG